jgi:hypothetical protein
MLMDFVKEKEVGALLTKAVIDLGPKRNEKIRMTYDIAENVWKVTEKGNYFDGEFKEFSDPDHAWIFIQILDSGLSRGTMLRNMLWMRLAGLKATGEKMNFETLVKTVLTQLAREEFDLDDTTLEKVGYTREQYKKLVAYTGYDLL